MRSARRQAAEQRPDAAARAPDWRAPAARIRRSLATRTRRSLAILAGLLAAVTALAACGGGELQDAGLTEDEYQVRIARESLEPVQRLAKSTVMRLAIENVGSEAVPNLAVTVKVLSEDGLEARQAFSYRDPQANLARPDRPIWILDSGYPVLAGSGRTGNAVSANPRTFQFGELAPGETAEIAWRLTPVKAGTYRLGYRVAADLYGVGTLVGRRGERPAGVLPVRVLEQPQWLRVTGDGRVVPINAGPRERPQEAPDPGEKREPGSRAGSER